MITSRDSIIVTNPSNTPLFLQFWLDLCAVPLAVKYRVDIGLVFLCSVDGWFGSCWFGAGAGDVRKEVKNHSYLIYM